MGAKSTVRYTPPLGRRYQVLFNYISRIYLLQILTKDYRHLGSTLNDLRFFEQNINVLPHGEESLFWNFGFFNVFGVVFHNKLSIFL
jgi:hypothetical protein